MKMEINKKELFYVMQTYGHAQKKSCCRCQLFFVYEKIVHVCCYCNLSVF